MTNAMTVKDLLVKYVREHEEGLAESTIETCRSGVSVFSKFLERDGTVADLNQDTLLDYADWLVATSKSKYSAASNFRTVKFLARFAIREGLVRSITKWRRIKATVKNPTAWSDEHARNLINTALKGVFADGKTHLRNGPPKGLFFACLFAVAWDTSLRLGDLLDLTWSELTIDPDGSARAVVTQNKTGNLVPVSVKPDTVKLLRKLRDAYKERQEQLLAYPYRREHLYRSVKTIVNAAGVPEGGMRFLRRGSATAAELLQPGAGKVALGHRSDWTSQTHYLDQNILAKRTLAKPNVLSAGEGGHPLVVISDIPQWPKREIPPDDSAEVVAAKLLFLAFHFGDEPFPEKLPKEIQAKVDDYRQIALENLYGHKLSDDEANALRANTSLSKTVRKDRVARFGHVVMAKIDGVLVGVCQFHEDGLIHGLAVHPDYRRQGVGRSIIAEILKRCGRVEALTYQLTDGAKAFAKAIGLHNPQNDSIEMNRTAQAV